MYVEKESELDLRVRQTKANFAPKIKPFGLSFAFGAKQVSIETGTHTDTGMMDEERVPVREIILAALLVESRTVPVLVGLTGAPRAPATTTWRISCWMGYSSNFAQTAF